MSFFLHRRTPDEEWDDGEGIPAVPRHGNWAHGLLRLLDTVLVVGLICYAGLFLLLRTDGFKFYIQQMLADRYHWPVTIGKMACDARLNLAVEKVAWGEAGRPGVPGLRIGKARVRWSLRVPGRHGWWRVTGVELENIELDLAPAPRSLAVPSFLRSLNERVATWGGTDRPTAAESAGETGEAAVPAEEGAPVGAAAESIAWTVRNARLTCWNAATQQWAFVTGLDLTLSPVQLPNRQFVHCYLELQAVELPGTGRLSDVVFETIKIDGKSVIINFQADGRRAVAPVVPSAADFREGAIQAEGAGGTRLLDALRDVLGR